MKKSLQLLAVAILSVFLFSSVCIAGERSDHNKCTEEILFGSCHAASLTPEQEDIIQMLEYASYLALDQYNGNGQNELSFLEQAGVKNLPTLDSINFTGNSQHRSYTHRGWDKTYVPDKANWCARKIILIETAKKAFPLLVDEEQTDAFCALIYYCHIVCDAMSDQSYKKDDLQIPFGGHAGRDKNDAIQEILKYLPMLFPSQTGTHTYRQLTVELKVLNDKVTTLSTTTGGINTDDKFREYIGYAEDLKELLTAFVPRLLKKEAFFSTVF